MSTSEQQATDAGPHLGTDVEVMLGEELRIPIEISTSATISLQSYDTEFLELNGAGYQGPNPGEDGARFVTTFKTQRQGRTVLQYSLAPNPLTPLMVAVQYNVTIIGF